MNTDEYLARGRQLHDEGHETDGCTFIGWLIKKYWPELTAACWSHDYGRRLLIPLSGQAENDNLFKDALKWLGAPRWLRFIMYTFTRAQGHAADKWSMTLHAFVGLLFFVIIVLGMFYGAGAFGKERDDDRELIEVSQ